MSRDEYVALGGRASDHVINGSIELDQYRQIQLNVAEIQHANNQAKKIVSEEDVIKVASRGVITLEQYDAMMAVRGVVKDLNAKVQACVQKKLQGTPAEGDVLGMQDGLVFEQVAEADVLGGASAPGMRTESGVRDVGRSSPSHS